MDLPKKDDSQQLSWHGELTSGNFDDMVKYNQQFRQARIEQLRSVMKILQEIGVQFWIDCGSLLGAYRNGKMMPHDNDTDIGIIDHEAYETARKVLRERLPKEYTMLEGTAYAEKFQIDHEPSGRFEFSKDVVTSNVSCDVNKYAYREDGTIQQLYYRFGLGERRYQSEWLFPLGTITFEGMEVPCPRNTKLYLEEMYGYLGTDFKYDTVLQKFVKQDP